MRSVLLTGSMVAVALVLVGCGAEEASPEVGQIRSNLTAGAASGGPAVTTVPDRYIVVFKRGVAQRGVAGQGVSDIGAAMRQAHGGSIYRTYQYALEGLAMVLSPTEVASVRADARVAYVEPEQIGSIVDTQPNATWGLDRVDQRQLPLNQSYTFPNQGGAGAHAYVLDTGIFAGHPEFAATGGGSRVIPGVDFQDNDADPDDCNGHGTHVAGTIGSATWGVAKKVTLHSVRVCDCFGFCPLSSIISGIDYVTNNHISPAVANISLRTGFSQAENDAVTNSIASGVVYGIAAANDSQDACLTSPGSTPNAITVAASDITDTPAGFTDFGTCVDLFAPGVAITSTWISPQLTNTIDGTSMATPHVVGVAALIRAATPSATPAQVAQTILSQSTPNVIVNPPAGTPNRLLYMGFLNTAPPANPCAGLCANPTNVTINGSFQSGNLGTGAVCLQTTSVVHGGNCGNFVNPRTLSVNGSTRPCNNQNWSSVPPARNGGYCIQTTAGNQPWAYVTLF